MSSQLTAAIHQRYSLGCAQERVIGAYKLTKVQGDRGNLFRKKASQAEE